MVRFLKPLVVAGLPLLLALTGCHNVKRDNPSGLVHEIHERWQFDSDAVRRFDKTIYVNQQATDLNARFKEIYLSLDRRSGKPYVFDRTVAMSLAAGMDEWHRKADEYDQYSSGLYYKTYCRLFGALVARYVEEHGETETVAMLDEIDAYDQAWWLIHDYVPNDMP